MLAEDVVVVNFEDYPRMFWGHRCARPQKNLIENVLDGIYPNIWTIEYIIDNNAWLRNQYEEDNLHQNLIMAPIKYLIPIKLVLRDKKIDKLLC